jgi:hypothetical protein
MKQLRIEQIQDAYIARRDDNSLSYNYGNVVFTAVAHDVKSENNVYSIRWAITNPDADNIMDMCDWNIYTVYKYCELTGQRELQSNCKIINLRGAIRHQNDADYLKFARSLIFNCATELRIA